MIQIFRTEDTDFNIHFTLSNTLIPVYVIVENPSHFQATQEKEGKGCTKKYE